MLHFVASGVGLIAAAASLWGWGAAVQHAARMPRASWPVTVALGLAALIAIGGVLNLARLAFAPSLWLATLLGVALFAVQARSLVPPRPRIEDGLAALFIGLAVACAIVTQLPPAVVNPHDDFEKYFAHPVRMLATGTLAGSPLNSLGATALGGMAYLHGFVASVLPVACINGVDAVFGFALLLCLGAVAGARRLAPLPGALLLPILIVCIDPQYVNVTALYLGAALMATAVMLAAAAPAARPAPLALGLIYASLVALKPTFALFPPLHLSALALAASLQPGQRRAAVAWSLRVAAVAALALLPWVAMYLPNYLATPVARPDDVPAGTPEGLLQWILPSPYGASALHYGLLAAGGIVAAMLGLRALRAPATAGTGAGLAASALAGVLAWLVALALAPVVGGRVTTLRLAVPLLLGTAPFALALAAALPLPRAERARTLVAAALAAVALCFAPIAGDRHARAWGERTALAYLDASTPVPHRDYFRHALSDAGLREVRALQAWVPAGEPVVAWIARPFQLDYARNPIIDSEPAGVASFWARVPADVHYVIRERGGWPMRSVFDYALWRNSPGSGERTVAVRAQAFERWLDAQARRGEILHDDGRFVVFRLAPPGVGTDRLASHLD